MLALWLLVACASEPEPGPPPDPLADPTLTRAPVSPAPTQAWSLAGRHRPGALDVPAWPEGAALLPAGCDATCLAERWTSPGGERWFVRTAAKAWSQDGPDAPRRPAPASWRTLGGVLSACLGDPLRLPPAWDPGGARGYDGTDWVLLFTGDNPCGLTGTLRLGAHRDGLDTDGLAVDGRPWARGGREAAEARAKAYNAAR